MPPSIGLSRPCHVMLSLQCRTLTLDVVGVCIMNLSMLYTGGSDSILLCRLEISCLGPIGTCVSTGMLSRCVGLKLELIVACIMSICMCPFDSVKYVFFT